MATSVGKIGRLPKAQRKHINQMILDNRKASEIIAWLKSEGLSKAELPSPQNVSSWKKYGYQRWLRRRERLQEEMLRREWAEELVKEGGTTILSDAASKLAVDNILNVLEDFDINDLKLALRDKPLKFLDLVDSLQGVRAKDQKAAELEITLYRHRQAMKKVEDLAEEKGAVTQDDIAAIFREGYGIEG